jgi:hypothetical protein
VATNELSATQLKLYAGQLSSDMSDGTLLNLRISFDQFPHEVGPRPSS